MYKLYAASVNEHIQLESESKKELVEAFHKFAAEHTVITCALVDDSGKLITEELKRSSGSRLD